MFPSREAEADGVGEGLYEAAVDLAPLPEGGAGAREAAPAQEVGQNPVDDLLDRGVLQFGTERTRDERAFGPSVEAHERPVFVLELRDCIRETPLERVRARRRRLLPQGALRLSRHHGK